MPDVTIDISNEAAELIDKMMAAYAEKTGRPKPTLQTAVATFFVVGFRQSLRLGDKEGWHEKTEE